MTDRRPAAVQRVLAALAVVGVLAMHGLAGGHHGAVPALPSVTAAAEHAAHHVSDAGSAVALAPLHVVGAGCHGDCGDHQAGLALLCAAVLLVAAGTLLRALAARTWRTVPVTGASPHERPRTRAPPRRLDLVADLGVSRT